MVYVYVCNSCIMTLRSILYDIPPYISYVICTIYHILHIKDHMLGTTCSILKIVQHILYNIYHIIYIIYNVSYTMYHNIYKYIFIFTNILCLISYDSIKKEIKTQYNIMQST